MSERKENLKKSLGITEYPWSSDEDETGSTQPQEVQLVRRQNEPRPSTSDMPGPSGLQPPPDSPSSTRKHQAKMDRNLFWSIINNTTKPSSIGTLRSSSRSRYTQSVPSSTLRESSASSSGTQRERAERTPNADIQRILAFKTLTRSLDRLSQNKPSNVLYSMSSRGNSGPSRSPLFTPGATESRRRWQDPRRQHTATYLAYRPISEPQSSSAPSRPRRVPPPRDTSLDIGLPSLTVPFVSLDHSDEEATELAVEDEPMDQGNTGEENAGESFHNSSAGGVSLEEEIVEVEPMEEPVAEDPPPLPPPPPPAPLGLLSPSAPAETVAQNGEASVIVDVNAVPVNAENAEAQTQPHGVKRKRDANDERSEPMSSVQEFNQSLLRLLECPVCLEWMEPPIAQCRRGHLVCARCRARLAACPVCRTGFSSVRNRAMEGVAEMLRYPCRHACGREVRLRRRAAHEASCAARRYACPAPACACAHPLQRQHLADHFQSEHLSILKIGRKHKFSLKVNSEQHHTWLVMALEELFSLRVDVDIRTWGVDVYVAYIGPKCNAKHYVYEVTVEGQHNARKTVYARTVHSDLESPSLNVSRQDCFHLTLDQALNYLRFKNRHCESDKFLDFNVEITKCETNDTSKEDSES